MLDLIIKLQVDEEQEPRSAETRIKMLEEGLREACDWVACVSSDASMEQRAVISRLRKLADGDSTTPS